jgi:hypothetical protein
MFAVAGELPALARWEIPLPEGPIAVGPDGIAIGVDDAEADRRIEDHHRPALEARAPVGETGFAIVMLVAAIGAIVGVCECPSMAIAVAVPAAMKAAEAARRPKS